MLQQLINGVTTGSIYGLLAVGLTMIFLVLKMVQVAHGEVFMVGAYFGLFGLTVSTSNVLVGLLAATVATAGLGILIERALLRPFLGRVKDDYPAIVITIALALLLSELVRLFVNDGIALAYPYDIWLGNSFAVFGVRIEVVGIVALVLLVGVTLGMDYVLRRTRIGMGARAMASNFAMARLLGVRVDRIAMGTVAFASALAAIVGLLTSVRVGSVQPSIGTFFGLKALAIALFAGLGNVRGAVWGGLLLGVAESMIVTFTSGSYQDALAFGMIIAILIFRPQGMFGAPPEVATQG